MNKVLIGVAATVATVVTIAVGPMRDSLSGIQRTLAAPPVPSSTAAVTPDPGLDRRLGPSGAGGGAPTRPTGTPSAGGAPMACPPGLSADARATEALQSRPEQGETTKGDRIVRANGQDPGQIVHIKPLPPAVAAAARPRAARITTAGGTPPPGPVTPRCGTP